MRIIRGSEIEFVPAAHEDPAKPGVLKRVLAKRDELIDGRIQMINWSHLPAGNSFAAHYHEDMEEVFIIVSGEVEVIVDEASSRLSAGDAIVISPREVHKMTNVSQVDMEYLVVGIAMGQNGQTVVVE